MINFRNQTVAGLIAGLALVSTTAHAKRYVIRVKDSNARTYLDRMSRAGVESPLFSSSVLSQYEGYSLTGLSSVNVKNAQELAELQARGDIEVVEPEIFYSVLSVAPTSTFEDDGEYPWGIKAVNAEGAWAAANLGSGGEGARVVVLDTGIDKDHPDLKNRFVEGANFVEVRLAEDFGGLSLAAATKLLKIGCTIRGCDDLLGVSSEDLAIDNGTDDAAPYDFFDRNGHGSHVAGTIAGEKDGHGVVGVAPNAKILAGRVCGKFGCSNISIVKGIEWAVMKKAHVINMSLGSPLQSRAIEQAVNAADAAGVLSVAAAGNDGTGVIGYPAKYEKVLAVGAVDPKLVKTDFSQYGVGLDVVAPGLDIKSSIPQGSGRESVVQTAVGGAPFAGVKSTSFVGSPTLLTPVVGELVFVGLGKDADFAGKDLTGKFAFIQRGEIPFTEKVKNAINAKAAGIVIFNNAPGLIQGSLSEDGSELPVGVVMIEQAVGEAIKAQMVAGQVAQLSMQTTRSDYSAFAGTSMASPHVAGVAALVRAARPSLTPAQVHALLKGTARTLGAENEYGKGLTDAAAAVQTALSMP